MDGCRTHGCDALAMGVRLPLGHRHKTAGVSRFMRATTLFGPISDPDPVRIMTMGIRIIHGYGLSISNVQHIRGEH